MKRFLFGVLVGWYTPRIINFIVDVDSTYRELKRQALIMETFNRR